MPAWVAVGETVILLTPPFFTRIETPTQRQRGCPQNDSLADGQAWDGVADPADVAAHLRRTKLIAPAGTGTVTVMHYELVRAGPPRHRLLERSAAHPAHLAIDENVILLTLSLSSLLIHILKVEGGVQQTDSPVNG